MKAILKGKPLFPKVLCVRRDIFFYCRKNRQKGHYMNAEVQTERTEKQVDTYAVYEKLRNEKGVSTYRVAHDLKIPECSFSNWKSQRFIPGAERLKKLADYFGVTMDAFFEGVQPEKKAEGGGK